jgi:hypothetical protein
MTFFTTKKTPLMFLRKYLHKITILCKVMTPMNDYPLSHQIHLVLPLLRSRKMGLKRLCHSTILFMSPKSMIKQSVKLALALQVVPRTPHIRMLALEGVQEGAAFTAADHLS